MRQITPTYFVSPQIIPEDLPDIAAAGIARIICNRPDAENPPDLRADAMRTAAEAAGLDFAVLEIAHQSMTPENAARQREMIETASGPVLAYCASGTRCSVIWALGQAGRMATDDILARTAAAGYALEQLRPALDQMAAARDA